jgi:O-antigen/teichoic acid export membrane protein
MKSIRKLFKNDFVKNSFIYTTGALLSGFLSYIFHFVISRKLSVDQYGELHSLASVLAIFGVFASAVSYFVIKYSSVLAKAKDYSATKKFIDLLNSKLNTLVVFLFVFLLLISPFINGFLKLTDYYGLIIVFIIVVFSIVSVVYSGVLVGWEEFYSVNFVSVLSAFVKLLFGALIVYFLPTASAVVFSLLVSGLGAWVLLRYFNNKKLFSKADLSYKEDWHKKYFSGINIHKSIVPISIFSLMLVLIGNVDIILVKNLTSSEITGYYSALKILGLVIVTINSSIISVILPKACAEANSGGVGRKVIAGAYGLISLVSVSSTIFYFLFPQFVISALFGDKYILFANDLWLFGVSSFIFSLLMLETNFAYARYDFRVSYVLGVVVLLIFGGIYLFHSNIHQIILDIIVSFGIGYLGVFAMNLLNKKKEIVESSVML